MVESGSRFTQVRPYVEEEDHISNLPEDILVLILNLITTKGGGGVGKKGAIEQVVRTSVLSRRWRFLWNYSLKSLTFTLSKRDSRCYVDDDSVGEAAHRGFVDRVNLILALPVVGDTIDDFNLTFWLAYDQTYWYDHLPSWIGFALQKRVKRLSIKLNVWGYFFTLDDKTIRNHNMDSLVSLRLDCVDVTGEFLEHLLTICRSLEHLFIEESRTLVDFTVSGPCLKLKYLGIHSCLMLQRLYIHHVNLVWFDYDPALESNNAAVVIEDAPHLVNASLRFFKGKDNTVKVLSYLPHLRTLILAFVGNCFQRSLLVFPKLMNLVKVELELRGAVFSSTICASLLVSCPFMSELLLKHLGLIDVGYKDKVERLKHPHECLKVVELVGFIGCKLDTGVALYIIENTVLLEKIVIDTSQHYRVDQYEPDNRERARAHARVHLASRLSGTGTQIIVK